jgi:hypothetical protein
MPAGLYPSPVGGLKDEVDKHSDQQQGNHHAAHDD